MIPMMLPGKVLEWVNGYLFIVCLGLTAFYWSYLLRRWRAGYRYNELKIGLAMWVYVLGDTIIRAPVWYFRHLDNGGQPITRAQSDLFWEIATIGAVFAIIGGLCALRVSAPERMGWWPWVGTAVLALCFASFAAFFWT